jgi:diphthine-ammonia ligase
MVSGVFAPPLDASWLGRTLDAAMVERLSQLQRGHGINPAGEGGELETTVLWAPLFRGRLVPGAVRRRTGADWGVLEVGTARLVGP